MLRDYGFDARVIRGGIDAWEAAGLPVEAVPEEDKLRLPSFARK
jgi:3-mercaptopyruvate sulfurtransferase SseA